MKLESGQSARQGLLQRTYGLSTIGANQQMSASVQGRKSLTRMHTTTGEHIVTRSINEAKHSTKGLTRDISSIYMLGLVFRLTERRTTIKTYPLGEGQE